MIRAQVKASFFDRAKLTVLAVVALVIAAAGVTPARATGIAPTLGTGGSWDLSATGTGTEIFPTTSQGAHNSLGTYNNLVGVSLSGSIGAPVLIGAQGGLVTLVYDYSGSVSSSPGVNDIPVAWDFTLSTGDAAATLGWDLDIKFNNGATNNDFHSVTGLTGSTSYRIDSSSPTYVYLPAVLSSYEVKLTATFNHAGAFSGTDSINIPGETSIDLNVAADPSVPEPSSWLLLFTGVGAILWKRARARVA